MTIDKITATDKVEAITKYNDDRVRYTRQR